MADGRPRQALDGAVPRLSAGPCRRDRQQPRPAPARRHAKADRADRRAGRRAAPGLDAARQLHRRALGSLVRRGLPPRRPGVRHPGLHGLVRVGLLDRRLGSGLVGRPAARADNRRALWPRGRAALRDGQDRRGRRGHRPLSRRARRAPPAEADPRHRRPRDGAPGLGAGPADLGHVGIWLARDHRARAGRGARLFLGRALLRRADDGGRRLLPGPAGAALVRRQRGADRRLAGDLAPGDGAARGARGHRRRASVPIRARA